MNQNLEAMLANAARKIKEREEEKEKQEHSIESGIEKNKVTIEEINLLGDKIEEKLNLNGNETIEEIRAALVLQMDESDLDSSDNNEPFTEEDLKTFDLAIEMVDETLDKEDEDREKKDNSGNVNDDSNNSSDNVSSNN